MKNFSVIFLFVIGIGGSKSSSALLYSDSCENIKDFDLIPSLESCSLYYQCIDGTAFRLSCPTGLWFDAEKQTCGQPEDVNCFQSTTTMAPINNCTDIPNFSYIPSYESCSLYYQCIDGSAFRLSCPTGLWFDIVRQTCDDPENANCILVPTIPTISMTTTTETTVTTSTSTTEGTEGTTMDPGICRNVPDMAYIPSPESCSLYYQCINGKAYLLACPLGLWFDVQIQTCDDPENVECDLETRPTTSTSTSTASTPTIPIPIPSNCSEAPNFSYISSPESCSLYYQCIDGEGFRLSCPTGLWFDFRRQTCDKPELVDCVMTTSDLPSVPTAHPPITLCEGVLDETFVAHPFACSLFYRCFQNESIEQECPPNQWFSFNQQRCTRPYDADCELDPSICSPGDFYIPSLTRCAEYIICYDGEAIAMTCSDGKWFDPATKQFQPQEEVECDLEKPVEPSGKICDGVGDFLLAKNPEKCSEYFVCQENRPIIKLQCPEGQCFDEERQVCDSEDYD